MSSVAMSSLASDRLVSALVAFLLVYGLLVVLERAFHAVTGKGIDLGRPAKDRFVLRRGHEIAGVAGSVLLSGAALGLALVAS